MWATFTGESLYVHSHAERAPPGGARVQFFRKTGNFWMAGVDNLVVLACVLRATTKKGRQLFLEGGKCTPEKILST